mgnify:CR=1 FL=1
MAQALQEAMRLPWNSGGVRLAFVITDAAPHLDYGQSYTYADAARQGFHELASIHELPALVESLSSSPGRARHAGRHTGSV